MYLHLKSRDLKKFRRKTRQSSEAAFHILVPLRAVEKAESVESTSGDQANKKTLLKITHQKNFFDEEVVGYF